MRRLLEFLLVVTLLVALPFKAAYSKEKVVTIAVIDTGIDKALPNLCRYGHKSFVDGDLDPLVDNHGHGTHIAGIINTNAGVGNYCLVALKYYSDSASGQTNLVNMKKAINYAINIKVTFINISGGGPEANKRERELIKKALDKKIQVVVAAGNEHSNLDTSCNYFPACYDARLVVVGNLYQVNGESFLWFGEQKVDRKAISSNYGTKVTRWEVGTDVVSTLPNGKTGTMSGTSQATAVATGKLVRQALAK